MSRYIDADWLKELYQPYESYNGKELAVPIGAILANIDDAPSIDIVRCKDCRWLDKGENESCSWSMCTRYIGQYINVNADDFCSYGEREGE